MPEGDSVYLAAARMHQGRRGHTDRRPDVLDCWTHRFGGAFHNSTVRQWLAVRQHGDDRFRHRLFNDGKRAEDAGSSR